MGKVLKEIKVPLISVNDTSLTVIAINFKSGSFVKADDIILVFESSKIAYDVVADIDGFIEYLCETGNDYDVNAVVAKIWNEKPELISIKKDLLPERKTIGENFKNWNGKTIFSESALSLIKENNIDENNFNNSDFVNLNDVKVFLGIKPLESDKKTFAEKLKNEPERILPKDIRVLVEKLSVNKKREIRYLSSVQLGGLTSTINTFIETDGIFFQLNKAVSALKDSLLPVVIYETSRLLRKYRELNACFTGETISYYKDVSIGFAIDIGKGLKVLKIREQSTQTIGMIEEEILNLSGSYLDETLEADNLSDITFTITDLSAESVAFFKPLVNSMNSAILGISSIDEKLDRCIFSLTFDHRVTEGKLVANFLKDLKNRIESYRSKQLNETVCFKCLKTLEEDISDVGFMNCIQPDGEKGLICQSCLKGI